MAFITKIYLYFTAIIISFITVFFVVSAPSQGAASFMCKHQCNSADPPICNGNWTQTCKDCNGDQTYEWCNTTDCSASGQVCSGGICQAPTCIDSDGDNYGVCPNCGTAYGCLNNGNDCDDTKNYINPGSPETCDNNNNNCNSQTDEGCDDDNDNYCDKAMQFYSYPVAACPNSNLINGSWGDDCDDSKNNIKPGATEDCGNGIDEDCNGSDLICATVCNDNDNDGYGNPVSGCASPLLDCNNNNVSVNPGAGENCTNTIDDDCDNDIDCADAQCVADPGCVATCGNGACDVAGGECSSCAGDCTLAACCGNANVDFAGEQCDDGDSVNNDECNSCVKTYCSDGAIQNNPQNGDGITEQCDDGNTTAGDGCDANCQNEISCGNGVCDVAGGECSSCASDCNHAACCENVSDCSGAVSCWRFDGDFNDSSNGNNGTQWGGVGFTDGISGQAASFDGSDDRITVSDPVNGSLDFGTSDFSATVWIKTTAVYQGIIDKLLNIDGNNFHVFVDVDGKLAFMIHDGSTDYMLSSNTVVADGQWHYIGVVIDWSTFPLGTAYIYVDGALDNSGSIVNIGTSLSNSANLTIGDIPWWSAPPYKFNGLIDEIKLYNYVLLASDIQNNYQQVNALCRQ